MKRGKKAQVTIFIIIAIVLIGAGIIALFVTKGGGFSRVDNEYFNQPSIKPQVDSITEAAKICIENTADDSLELIGLQGGYYKQPENAFEVKDIFVPYYYYEGSISMPTKNDVQKELASFVDSNLLSCFDKLNFQNFNLEYKNPKTSVLINQNEVRFDVDMMLTIQREGKRTIVDMNNIPVKRTSALYDILDVAKYITDSQRVDDKLICVTCIANMAEEKNLYVDALDFKGNSVLFIISENYTSSEPYYFEFLNKYKA